MRLTLRTMLAHMDGLLEPEDDADIRQKIADSEFATKLLQRLQDVMRQTRLRAPTVSGPGLSGDPNSVAEYLDNTMLDEDVAEFEKMCLESDTNLAEVGACHQILTLVLGQPVEIDPATRDRMYGLPDVAAEELAESARARRERPTVPEYLREPKRTWSVLPVAGVVVAAVVIFALILAATGRLQPLLARLTGERPDEQPAAGAAGRDDLPATLPDVSADDSARGPGGAADRGPDDASSNDAEGELPDELPSELPSAGGSASGEAGPDGVNGAVGAFGAANGVDAPAGASPADITPADTSPVDPSAGPSRPTDDLAPGVSDQPDATDQPGDDQPPGGQGSGPDGLTPEQVPGTTPAGPNGQQPNGSPADEPGTGASIREPGEPILPPGNFPGGPVEPTTGQGGSEPGAEAGASPTGADQPSEGDTGEQVDVDVVPEDDGSGSPDAEPESLGRFISERQLLIEQLPNNQGWRRVAMQNVLPPAQPMLALPTFRPVLALTSGVSVQLVGGSQLTLRSSVEDGPPTLDIAFGKLTLHTVGKAGAACRLKVGERIGTLIFENAEAGAAAWVHRVQRPGVDPAAEPAPLVLELWCSRGKIVWREEGEGQPALEMSAPSRVVIRQQSEQLTPLANVELPEWRTEGTGDWLDQRAAPVLLETVQPDRPAGLALRELADAHRQREVRWLALRSLGYLGEFGSMVTVLDDEESKPVWNDYIEQLARAIDRDPKLAQSVREALLRQYGDDGPILYRMLWGYTPDQLEQGAAARLVELLDHERLAVRLLAFWNLREITGLGLFYRPEHNQSRREQSLRRWRERLESGEIVRKAREQQGS